MTLSILSGEQNSFQGQKCLERHWGSQREAKSWASVCSGLPSFLAGITPLGILPTPKLRLISVEGKKKKKQTHPPSLQGTASHLLAGCHEVFLSLGIKCVCHLTPTSLLRLSSAPSPCNTAASDPQEPSQQPRWPHFQRDDLPKVTPGSSCVSFYLIALLSDRTQHYLPPGFRICFYRWRNRGPERRGNLLQVTQLANARGTGWPPSPGLWPRVTCWLGLGSPSETQG